MKIFVSFLLIYFVGAFLLWLLAVSVRSGRHAGRGLYGLLLLLLLVLYLVSTPVGSDGLSALLTPGWGQMDGADERDPDYAYIVVLGGGVVYAQDPVDDIPSPESALRVARGVSLARHYPGAKVIISGGSGIDRDGPSVVQLMASNARARGLEGERIVLEPLARNTRDHPPRVLDLPGVNADTPLLVVTSGPHLRRTRREFDRTFATVAYAAADRASADPRHWASWLPQEQALAHSTFCLREIIGGLWYRLTVDS